MTEESLSPEEVKRRTRDTFNATAGHFDELPFWGVIGSRTVELAGVAEGDRVLDVCCGTGASALPAARRARDAGSVVGVDLAGDLLELGRRKAAAEGLSNIGFEVGDMTNLRFRSGEFDVVQCVLGIFFVPDEEAALRHLWDKVAPGGTLAVTVWGERVLEPLNTIYRESAQQVRPDLVRKDHAWLEYKDPQGFSELWLRAGLPQPDIAFEQIFTPLDPQDLWTVVEGTGYRGVVDRMEPGEVQRFKQILLARASTELGAELVSDLQYGRARKTG